MQDRANVSADFLELMKQEIIEVIKKYIDVDESAIDVRMTNRQNEDGTNGAPALYANIPIMSIKDDVVREKSKNKEQEEKHEDCKENVKVEDNKTEENPITQNIDTVETEKVIETLETEEKVEPNTEETVETSNKE